VVPAGVTTVETAETSETVRADLTSVLNSRRKGRFKCRETVVLIAVVTAVVTAGIRESLRAG